MGVALSDERVVFRSTRPPATRRGRVIEFEGVQPTIVFGALSLLSETGVSLVGSDPIVFGTLALESRTFAGFETTITGQDYHLIAVDENGVRQIEIASPQISNVGGTLNNIASLTFRGGVLEEALQSLTAIETELQLWKGDALLFWGVIVRPQADPRVASFQVPDVRWYFTKRHFGKASRDNLLTNPSFEDKLSGWTTLRLASFAEEGPFVGIPGFIDPEFEGHTTPVRFDAPDGRRVLRFKNTKFGNTRTDGWKVAGDVGFQTVTVTAPADRPAVVTVSTRFKITGFSGPGDHSFGLVLATFPSGWPDSGAFPGTFLGIFSEFEDVNFTIIDEATPLGEWIDADISIVVEPGETKEVGARASGIFGTIEWDDFVFSVDEGLSFKGTELKTVIEAIAAHAQDPAFDKTDFNIGVTGSDTGRLIDFIALFHNHEPIWDRLLRLVEDEQIDLGLELTPTSRNLAIGFPYLGRSASTSTGPFLEYGRDFNGFVWSFDGERASNQAIVLGEGLGSTRPEAAAEDLTVFGGKSIESVHYVPPGTSKQALPGIAADRVRVLKSPDILELIIVETAEGGPTFGLPIGIIGNLMGKFSPGDRGIVNIQRGFVQIIAEAYRVVAMDLQPDRNKLRLTLNRWTEDHG